MLPKNVQEISTETGEIPKFYAGKSILITGGAGFLGTVILETLLRCCPGILKIYILLRSKNGMEPEDRKSEIFNKPIFTKLKEDDPDALKKVAVISGDVTKEKLGMSEIDLRRITKEVSIVIHCAATISFFKPLSFIMEQNVIGTDNIIDFCRKLTKLDVLVYSSTIFSNGNHSEIDEKIYKLPFKAEYALLLTRNREIGELNRLFESFDPPFPNFYTFSKCVTENLLDDKASDLPICIVRPSIIVCCIKGPVPGYISKGSSLVSLSLGMGKGVIRVAPVYNQEINIDIISGDVAANTHIVAAYFQATKGLSSPFIYNCTADDRISWKVWFYTLLNMVLQYPIPNSYLLPSVVLCYTPLQYKIYSFIYHYLPAYAIDIFLWMVGSEFRMVKTYKFYERSVEKVQPFLKSKWQFNCENFKSLREKLNSTDAELFCVDVKHMTLEKFTECLRSGCPFYLVDNKPYKENFRSTLIRYFLTYLLRCTVIGSLILFFYMVLFKGIVSAVGL